MNYTYEKTELIKVPSYKSSEPALSALFEAKRLRDEREKTFDPDFVIGDRREEYLASVGEELQVRGRAVKYHIYEIGRLLCDAKRLLPHGEFQPWVEEHFEHSYRTAKNCMHVYEVCMGQPEVLEYFSATCLEIICAPNFPADLRTALFENVKGPVAVNKKRLVQVGIKFRNGEIGIESPAVQELLHRQLEFDARERCKIELKALETIIRDRWQRITQNIRQHGSQPLITERRDPQEWIDKIEAMIVGFQAELHSKIGELEK
jgi:hypothetical protein